MMWEKITEALAGSPDVSEWVVRIERRRGAQIFLAGERVESRRRVATEQASIDVHVDHDGARGTSSFVVLPGEDSAARAKIEQAVFMARLSANPPFTLPRPAGYPEVEIADPQILSGGPAVVDEIAESVLRVLHDEPHIRPSSLELFADDGETHLLTSAGVDAWKHGTRLLMEAVVLSEGHGRESERHALVEWRRTADLPIEPFIREQAQFARDALEGAVPDAGRYPVVVRGQDVASLFEPFLYHAGASTKYRKMGRFELGDRVLDAEGEGEPLEIVSDALLPYGLESQPFDAEGLPGTRVVLVRDSRLKNLWATNRYAQYLSVPATGSVANLIVPCGAQALDALLADGPVIEVVAFSDLDPDAVTGDFVGEIRLGYLHEGGRRRTLKGGSVSGNVFSDLARARYSREAMVRGAYHGPAAVRLEGLEVAGE